MCCHYGFHKLNIHKEPLFSVSTRRMFVIFRVHNKTQEDSALIISAEGIVKDVTVPITEGATKNKNKNDRIACHLQEQAKLVNSQPIEVGKKERKKLGSFE